MPDNQTILTCSSLSAAQKEAAAALVNLCCRHDQMTRAYPFAEDDVTHYLLYGKDQLLCAILAWIDLDDTSAECMAFTRPDLRRQGCFSMLLDRALETHGEQDLYFAASETCADTLAVLDALGAERTAQEHQMERFLSEDDRMDAPNSAPLALTPALPSGQSLAQAFSQTDTTADTRTDALTATPLRWILSDSRVLGTCHTSLVSARCVCLHDVEITPELRGQGFGTRLLALLFSALSEAGIQKILLQVSGDNHAAMALYKKAGFRITETLSYYLY
ncbi:MAG: GNAT family N-acetyltransferase [Lachnospiraceae bacterium]|nr:GNAT family N-acetyltransferase [Lachnospiraceae bacterium]